MCIRDRPEGTRWNIESIFQRVPSGFILRSIYSCSITTGSGTYVYKLQGCIHFSFGYRYLNWLLPQHLSTIIVSSLWQLSQCLLVYKCSTEKHTCFFYNISSECKYEHLSKTWIVCLRPTDNFTMAITTVKFSVN